MLMPGSAYITFQSDKCLLSAHDLLKACQKSQMQQMTQKPRLTRLQTAARPSPHSVTAQKYPPYSSTLFTSS